MRMVLVSSGVGWLDDVMGGWPTAGVVVVVGGADAGKTTLALQSTLAALGRGPTCFVTNDLPASMIETSRAWLERDVAAYLGDRLTLLSFAPFFVNKVQSLRSVDAPLAELGRLVAERGVRHVVFDTLDPLLTWADPAEAAVATRRLLTTMNSWGIPVLCTARSPAAATAELARAASAHIELGDDEIVLRHTAWCSERDLAAPRRLVQGCGIVVDAAGAGMPPSERPVGGPGSAPWSSLISDGRALAGASEAEWDELSLDVFSAATRRR